MYNLILLYFYIIWWLNKMRLKKFVYWWRNSKIRSFFKKIRLWIKNGIKVKFILLMYVLVVLIIIFFLYSKIIYNFDYVVENKIIFWDVFFIICSVFSNIGLVSYFIYKVWNMFG